jgi:plastocyanin
MTPRSLVVILPLLLLVALVARADSTTQPSGEKRTVSIKGMHYSPEKLEIKVGDTVTWTNLDDRDHTVVASDGSFKSGNLGRGESFSFKFKKPGTYTYACKYHPRMKATIVVKAD